MIEGSELVIGNNNRIIENGGKMGENYETYGSRFIPPECKESSW